MSKEKKTRRSFLKNSIFVAGGIALPLVSDISLKTIFLNKSYNHFKVFFPIANDELPFEKGKSHQSSRGEPVRSRSEGIIADTLFELGVVYKYEHLFTIFGYTICPKFTIKNFGQSHTFYWEHNRFSHLPDFNKLWERRMARYKASCILPHENGGGENGTLIVTSDSPEKRISSQETEHIIRTVILEK